MSRSIPSNSAIQVLGMKDGDIVVNNVTKEVLVIENGNAAHLADFGETYIPGEGGLNRRWRLPILGGCLALLIAIFVFAKLRGRGRKLA